jgi:hypothetical protein
VAQETLDSSSAESNTPKAKLKRAAFLAAQLESGPSADAPDPTRPGNTMRQVIASQHTLSGKVLEAKRFAYQRTKGAKPIKIKKKVGPCRSKPLAYLRARFQMEAQHWLEL